MLIDIGRVIVKDRIRKDFGDIDELAEDIRMNGLINPPVVNKNYELLAGERRLRACKSLGWSQIEVRMMDTRDAEHELNVEISENDVRKGFSKSERVDYMKRLLRIEQAKAKERESSGGKGREIFPDLKGRSKDKTAEQFGISGKTMEKEISIVDNKGLLDPADFAEWDEGRLSTNKAFQKIKRKASNADREIKFYKDRIRTLEEQAKKPVTKEVVPDDYEALKVRAESAAKSEKRMADDYHKLQKELADSKSRIKDLEAREGVNTLKERAEKETEYFTLETYRFIRESGGHVWVFEQIKDVPAEKVENFKKAIYALDAFAKQMIQNIGGYNVE